MDRLRVNKKPTKETTPQNPGTSGPSALSEAGSSLDRHSSPIAAPTQSSPSPMADNAFGAKYWQQRRQVSTSGLTHVIFLTNPTFPSEHTTLVTPHRSRIK